MATYKKMAEHRLQMLPALRKKLKEDSERLSRINALKSSNIIRIAPGGYKLPPGEAKKQAEREATALGNVRELKRGIERDAKEIAELDRALKEIQGDSHYAAVSGKYMDGYDDEDIAADLGCGPTKLRKERKRLMRAVVAMLYGSRASGEF
jgi:hypothetical protein